MLLSQEEDDHFSLLKFESMLKTNKVLFFDSSEFENIIHYYLEEGKINLAKKALKLGLTQHPTSVELRLFQVEIYVFEEKLELGERLIDELQSIENFNEEIHIQKANILSKKGCHEEAVNELKTALEMTEDEADIYEMLGMEYLFVENFEEAKNCFEKCLEIDPEDFPALYNIVYCFEFLEKTEDAILFLNGFIERNPYSEIAWHELGRQYASIGMLHEAIRAYDFANLIDENFTGAYLEKGKVLEKLKRYREAIQNYKITLTLDDPSSFALLSIGRCYEKINKPKLAVRHYKEAVHIDPLLDKGWKSIAVFYLKYKNYPKALEAIQKAINLDGENSFYWKLSARIHTFSVQYEQAIEAYAKAISLGNYKLSTWLELADLLLLVNESEFALEQLLLAEPLFPNKSKITYRLAGLYFMLKNEDKAEFYLLQSLALNQSNITIIQTLFPDFFKSLKLSQILNDFKNSLL